MLSEDLLDILNKYNWQIVDHDYVEIVRNERERAWKDIIITALFNTPNTFKTHIRKATLENFDYNQPIYYNLKTKSLGLTNNEVIKALMPPMYGTINTKSLTPLTVLIVFIVAILSLTIWKGLLSVDNRD
ncbi:hypothetical protein SlGVgp104 [Spodoptera litura granulovirus]|uniref:Pif-6 n=1 Tax=Spodoptera litura granulovirus TaxID=359919 RepID=A5IZV6_9BBAC|nr:hypothetical protein SlGVgp104 [Spodoptera litura granulovirus]ABQ52047.1 hypothetical protein SlGVgp104 [Spodoptera litura granulovirus]